MSRIQFGSQKRGENRELPSSFIWNCPRSEEKSLLLGTPNDPECANFASILRLLIIGAISTQPCYVSTLCVDIALIIRVCKFAQI